jgi:hypothetical protein
MTPEELDEARAEEALQVYLRGDTSGQTSIPLIAARLAREGWQPPKVDPDLLAAREYAATRWPFESRAYRAGHQDDGITIPAYLAGCTRGREGAKGLVEAVENAHRALSVESLPALSRISRALDALASAKRGG